VRTVYAHLSELNVDVGQQIPASGIVGSVGTTGNVPPGAMPHLHFEIRVDGLPIDPGTVFERP